jgi:outer membrane protein TolC
MPLEMVMNEIPNRKKPGWQCPAWLAFVLLAPAALADRLSLENAEALALHADPSVQMVEARGAALAEQAVAARQLPDPMLKLGVMGLPTDTFKLGQEAMTQVQLGVVQKFPRGRSRELESRQLQQRSSGLDAMASDQRLRVVQSVQEAFLEVLLQERLAEINAEATTAFTDLADITLEYYGTGRVPQQDVLRASVELARVRDRATVIAQHEDTARAGLATWIGEAAYRELRQPWPPFDSLPAPEAILAGLQSHPRIRAYQQSVIAAETGVDLARQRYKPEFSVDLTYGGRGGLNPDGSGRSDLLSAMLMMDVPLFTGKRQDRVVAARVAESSAAAFGRDDVYRQLKREAEQYVATLKRQQERLELFRTILLPEADFNSEAALDAYQAAVADLTALMRARITEFELQLEYARLESESLKTRSRLQYLAGDGA